MKQTTNSLQKVGFFQMKDSFGGKNSGIPVLLGIFAGFMFLGILFTFLIPETKGRTLEELSDQAETSQKYKRSFPNNSNIENFQEIRSSYI